MHMPVGPSTANITHSPTLQLQASESDLVSKRDRPWPIVEATDSCCIRTSEGRWVPGDSHSAYGAGPNTLSALTAAVAEAVAVIQQGALTLVLAFGALGAVVLEVAEATV